MEKLNYLRYIQFFSILLLIYVMIGGFLFDVPSLPILNEAIRVLYFHVPMWFTMIFLLFISCINAFYFISNGKVTFQYFKHDPNLIAGLIMQIGSVMIDTSIKTKLKKLEKNMLEA